MLLPESCKLSNIFRLSALTTPRSWAADQATAEAAASAEELAATGKTKHKGSVANMSLGGGKSAPLDRAVDAAVDAGLNFAVAAGK